jgi:hypothetical protein
MAREFSGTTFDAYTSSRNVISSEIIECSSTTKLCDIAIQIKNVNARRKSHTLSRKPYQANQIKNMSNSPNKLQARLQQTPEVQRKAQE